MSCTAPAAQAPTPEPACRDRVQVPSQAPGPPATQVVSARPVGDLSLAIGRTRVAIGGEGSLQIRDRATGAPTAQVHGVTLLGVGHDDEILVLRDGLPYALGGDGSERGPAGDRRFVEFAPIPGERPARYLGRFQETSEVPLWRWVDPAGVSHPLVIDVRCESAPSAYAEGYRLHPTLSPGGRFLAGTTGTVDVSCPPLPRRVALWSMEQPGRAAETFQSAVEVERVLAIDERGERALLLARARGGAFNAVIGHLDREAHKVVALAVVPIGHASMFSGAFLPGDRVLLSGTASLVASGTGEVLWRTEGVIAIGHGSDIGYRLLDPDAAMTVAAYTLTAVRLSDGHQLWKRPIGSRRFAVSDDGLTVVAERVDGRELVLIDGSSGRLQRSMSLPRLAVAHALTIAEGRLEVQHGGGRSIWSLEDGTLVHRLPASQKPPRPPALVVEAGAASYVAGADGDDAPPSPKVALEVPPAWELGAPVLSSDGSTLAAGEGGQVAASALHAVVWNTGDGAMRAVTTQRVSQALADQLFSRTLDHRDQVLSSIETIALSPRGEHLAVATLHQLQHKPNWSYEVIEQRVGRVDIFATDGGGHLSSIPVRATHLAYLDSDTLITANEQSIGVIHGASHKEIATGGGEIVALAVDAKLGVAATAHRDGVVRVFGLAPLKLRATLYDFQDGESLAVTPGGAYTGTVEAAARVHWVFPAPLEPFRFESMAATYERPDVVRSHMAGEQSDLRPPHRRPPQVELVASPTETDGRGRLRVVMRSASRVDRARVYVEGRLVDTVAVCKDKAEVDFEVPIAAGANRVAVVAFDERGAASNPLLVDLVAAPPDDRGARSQREPVRKPEVWVVTAGVDRYLNLPGYDLAFAGADALAIARAFEGAAGPNRAFARAHVTVLRDQEVTPGGLLAALAGLSEMAAEDLAVVHLAGHGITTDGRMVFLTGGVEAGEDGRPDPASVERQALGWPQLAEALARARGRVVVFIDACHAGQIDRQVVVPSDQLARGLASGDRAGLVVFAAAKGRQQSLEAGRGRGVRLVGDPGAPSVPVSVSASASAGTGHGLFTAALLDALSAADTDRNGDRAVQLSELIEEVTWRVTRASGGRQTPWLVKRELFGDFKLHQLAAPAPPTVPAATPAP